MVVKVISGDHAVAWAARLARVEVVPAFPITPQTLIVEQLAEFVNNGELDADYIPVESEHSVMSVAVGASAGGVRTFTATASQGLALMHEMLYAAPQIRLPVVMANANRSLGAGAGIWLEHNDSMPERESGWLQCYVEDNQEALDMTLQAFRIAEDHRVMLPMMIVPGRFRPLAHCGTGRRAGPGGGGQFPSQVRAGECAGPGRSGGDEPHHPSGVCHRDALSAGPGHRFLEERYRGIGLDFAKRFGRSTAACSTCTGWKMPSTPWWRSARPPRHRGWWWTGCAPGARRPV